jgi:hypothetical protein
MGLPVENLKAKGGDLYANIFENDLAGIPRSLFWSVSMDFAPMQYEGSKFVCGMTIDWLNWTMRDWRELEGATLDVVYNDDGTVKSGPNGVEASFYMTAHDPALRFHLKLNQRRGLKFKTSLKMVVDFHGYAGGDENPEMLVKGTTDIDYRGVIIVKDNLSPAVKTKAKVLDIASQFIDLSAYLDPIDEEWRWLFPPKD